MVTYPRMEVRRWQERWVAVQGEVAGGDGSGG